MRKTAIIIGASSDIGIEIAKKMAEEGYSLALTYNKTHLPFEKLINGEVKTYHLDLLHDNIADFFNQANADFKFITSLVFCSGVAQKSFILDVKDSEIDDILDVNLKAPIQCVREFVKIVGGKHPANITLIGSFVEKNGCACESVYVASKTALSGFTRSIASEIGGMDIRINVVAPGLIDTKMNNNLSADEKDELTDKTPLQRIGKPEDVASAVAFLASEKANFITGQTLFVDGGLIIN